MSIALDRSPLSEESKKIAAQELRETPEVVQQALKELRELLKNDDTIYFADDDETLIIFLRPCKFYAKSAYELVIYYEVFIAFILWVYGINIVAYIYYHLRKCQTWSLSEHPIPACFEDYDGDLTNNISVLRYFPVLDKILLTSRYVLA